MKYLFFCIPLLFISCGDDSSTSNSNGEIVASKALSWDYEMVTVSGSNPVCPDANYCTNLKFEYPVFKGEGSERANLNVGRFLSERLGLVVEEESDLLNIEEMMTSYFDFWETQREIDPSLKIWKNDIKLTSIDNGLGITSLKFLIESSVGDFEPYSYYHVVNLTEKTGEEIMLINHVSDLPSFIMLSQNEFRNHYKMPNNQPYTAIGFDFEQNVYTLPFNYVFTSEGLEYLYNADEISLNATEAQSFVVSYKMLENLLDLKTDFQEEYFQQQRELEAELN
jgi:hypothetical protein